MDTKKIGNLGEKIAENYLKKKGYKILEKNYEFRTFEGPQKGEIDIIAKRKDTITFFEIKTLKQSQTENFLPEDKVDFFKQRKIIKSAESWLIKNKISFNSKWQIDVIGIIVDPREKKAKIRHFQNVVF